MVHQSSSISDSCTWIFHISSEFHAKSNLKVCLHSSLMGILSLKNSCSTLISYQGCSLSFCLPWTNVYFKILSGPIFANSAQRLICTVNLISSTITLAIFCFCKMNFQQNCNSSSLFEEKLFQI